jgi:hypothetical protein
VLRILITIIPRQPGKELSVLTVCTVVKTKGKISQNSVAFSEYMNFIIWSSIFMHVPNSNTLRHTRNMNRLINLRSYLFIWHEILYGRTLLVAKFLTFLPYVPHLNYYCYCFSFFFSILILICVLFWQRMTFKMACFLFPGKFSSSRLWKWAELHS